MKDILQNWSDEDAALILKNLHSIMRPDHRLLVMETIMHIGSHSEERVSPTTVNYVVRAQILPPPFVGVFSNTQIFLCMCDTFCDLNV